MASTARPLRRRMRRKRQSRINGRGHGPGPALRMERRRSGSWCRRPFAARRGLRNTNRRRLAIFFGGSHGRLLCVRLYRGRSGRLGWRGCRGGCGRRLFFPFHGLRHGNRLRWLRSRHILHDFAQRRRRSRLNALTGPSEHVVGDRRLSRGFAHGRQRRLQRSDGVIECQSVRLKISAALLRASPTMAASTMAPLISRLRLPRVPRPRLPPECASHPARRPDRLRARRFLSTLQDARDDIGFEALAIDMARIEHGDGVGVVAESREQMLKRHLGRPRRPGEVGAACQRRNRDRPTSGFEQYLWPSRPRRLLKRRPRTGQDWPDRMR